MLKGIPITILIAIYVVGVIASYSFIRYMKKRRYGKWTKFDRSAGLLMSLIGSWVGIFAWTITELIFPKDTDLNEPSKW